MSIYTGVKGTKKEIQNIYVCASEVSRNIAAVYTKNNNVVEKVYGANKKISNILIDANKFAVFDIVQANDPNSQGFIYSRGNRYTNNYEDCFAYGGISCTKNSIRVRSTRLLTMIDVQGDIVVLYESGERVSLFDYIKKTGSNMTISVEFKLSNTNVDVEFRSLRVYEDDITLDFEPIKNEKTYGPVFVHNVSNDMSAFNITSGIAHKYAAASAANLSLAVELIYKYIEIDGVQYPITVSLAGNTA